MCTEGGKEPGVQLGDAYRPSEVVAQSPRKDLFYLVGDWLFFRVRWPAYRHAGNPTLNLVGDWLFSIPRSPHRHDGTRIRARRYIVDISGRSFKVSTLLAVGLVIIPVAFLCGYYHCIDQAPIFDCQPYVTPV
jgi:hypothetical protein